jgi:hypothetical protein
VPTLLAEKGPMIIEIIRPPVAQSRHA